MADLTTKGPSFPDYRPLPSIPDKAQKKTPPPIRPRPPTLAARSVSEGALPRTKTPPPIDRSTKPSKKKIIASAAPENTSPNVTAVRKKHLTPPPRPSPLTRTEAARMLNLGMHSVKIRPETREFVASLASNPDAQKNLKTSFCFLSKNDKQEILLALGERAKEASPEEVKRLNHLVRVVTMPSPPVTEKEPLFKQEGLTTDGFASLILKGSHKAALLQNFVSTLTASGQDYLRTVHDPSQFYPFSKKEAKVGTQYVQEKIQLASFIQETVLTSTTQKEADKIALFFLDAAKLARKQGDENSAQIILSAFTGPIADDRLSWTPAIKKEIEALVHTIGSASPEGRAFTLHSFKEGQVPDIAYLNTLFPKMEDKPLAEVLSVFTQHVFIPFRDAHNRSLKAPPPEPYQSLFFVPSTSTERELRLRSHALRPYHRDPNL